MKVFKILKEMGVAICHTGIAKRVVIKKNQSL